MTNSRNRVSGSGRKKPKLHPKTQFTTQYLGSIATLRKILSAAVKRKSAICTDYSHEKSLNRDDNLLTGYPRMRERYTHELVLMFFTEEDRQRFHKFIKIIDSTLDYRKVDIDGYLNARQVDYNEAEQDADRYKRGY